MRIRTARCGRCGADVQLRDGAPSARCERCETQVSLQDALREEQASARRYPSETPLRVGMAGLFGGKRYQLIGRVVYSTVEEGETCFWEEFQLLAPDGDIFYLEYDEGQWKLLERFTPQNPIGPQEMASLRAGSNLRLEAGTSVVRERGKATVQSVQGELTYSIRAGDQVDYLEAAYLNRWYSVEWREEEIEFYRGKLLARKEVFHHFGLTAQISALEAGENRRRSQKYFAAVCLALSLLAFIFYGIALTGGKVISKESVDLNIVSEEGIRFGPVTLSPGMYVHRLIIYGSMQDASAWVAGVLETAGGAELVGTQRDFWDEHGYDADGAWHESDLRAQSDFVVREAQPYYVHLYVERDTPTGSFRNVGYELRGGVLHPTFFLPYGIIAFILAVVFFCVSSPETLQKLAESMDDDE
ncbi:MAG: DUF4178 domain-containing protein [Armatimonadetes bacterium]|nr:DUF4178 domain-containing protein [Armatimonadota bacterium]